MPPWGRLIPHNPAHKGPSHGSWALREARVSVGRGSGCDVTVDWFSGSRHQFDLEYDRATGAVCIKQVSSIARTFLNGGGPTGAALPVDKRVAVASDAANAPHQVAGVPDDAPLIFCDAPNKAFLRAARAPTLSEHHPPPLTRPPSRVQCAWCRPRGRQRVRRKRRNEATGEEEVYHPFASEYCGFTLLLEHGGMCLRGRPAPGPGRARVLRGPRGLHPAALSLSL